MPDVSCRVSFAPKPSITSFPAPFAYWYKFLSPLFIIVSLPLPPIIVTLEPLFVILSAPAKPSILKPFLVLVSVSARVVPCIRRGTVKTLLVLSAAVMFILLSAVISFSTTFPAPTFNVKSAPLYSVLDIFPRVICNVSFAPNPSITSLPSLSAYLYITFDPLFTIVSLPVPPIIVTLSPVFIILSAPAYPSI